jgi:plastocyanin
VTEIEPDAANVDSADSTLASGPNVIAVSMIDNAFAPDDLEVRAGDSVTWTNNGELPHTVTARDESFDSGFLMAGQAWTKQFDQVGVVEYVCIIHPEMVGTVRVIEALDGASGDQAAVSASTDAASATGGAEPGPAAAGVAGATEASIAVILLLVLLTVGFIIFLVNEVEFAPLPSSGDE